MFLAFLLVFLFGSANFVFAAEISLPGLNANSSVGDITVYLFKWGIGIAGSLALISFVWGAVMLIVSGDSTQTASSARDRMKSALLGLVLALASWLIINTINPNLEKTTLTPLPAAPALPAPPIQIQPGVYYYSKSGCDESGYISGPNTSSQDNVGAGIKSVKIVDDATNGVYYGVILHQEAGLKNGGQCSGILTGNSCIENIGGARAMSISAIDIFKLNKDPASSGNGVDFFSEPFGTNKGARAGFYSVPSAIIISPFLTKHPSTLTFTYTGINRPAEYINTYKTFQNHPGSINIKGNYLVAFYSSSLYCQTFTKDSLGIYNLKEQPIIAAEGVNLDVIDIIPIKP